METSEHMDYLSRIEFLERQRAKEAWEEISKRFYDNIKQNLPFETKVFDWLADNYYPPRERKK